MRLVEVLLEPANHVLQSLPAVFGLTPTAEFMALLGEPYELSVANLSRDTRKVWAQKVADSVSQMGDTIVWLLPKSYQKHIKPLLPDHQHLTPFDGLRGIGDIKRHCLAAESGDGWGTR